MTVEMSPIVPVNSSEKGLAPRDTRTQEEIAALRQLIVSLHAPTAGAIRNMRRLGERRGPYLGR